MRTTARPAPPSPESAKTAPRLLLVCVNTHARQASASRWLHLRHDVRDKNTQLLALLLSVAASVTHDNTAIAQINQTSQVVHDLRLRTGASITATVRASSGFPNIDKELVAQAEVRQASPVRLAQFVEHVETRPQALRAQPRGHPPVSQPGDPLQCRVGGATDQDGRMRTLYRPRTGNDGIKLIVL